MNISLVREGRCPRHAVTERGFLHIPSYTHSALSIRAQGSEYAYTDKETDAINVHSWKLSLMPHLAVTPHKGLS